MATNIIDIGLVCIGSELRVPIVACNENDILVPDVYVIVDVPDGVQYSESNLTRGSYNDGDKTWTIGSMSANECIVGELVFIIIDDSVPEYKFNYTISTTDNCAQCKDITGCVEMNGFSCTELRKCDPDVTVGSILICGSGTTCSGDVSTGDGACPAGLTRTFQWIDTNTVNGTITGDPDNFTYEPDEGFCGQSWAEYGLYCNDILYDKGRIRLDSTCASSAQDTCDCDINSNANCDVDDNDFPCFYGATTTWHLTSNPTLDGDGLSEPTSNGNVRIIEWNQSSGKCIIQSSGGFSGVVTFSYTLRCSSSAGVVYETDATTVTVTVG